MHWSSRPVPKHHGPPARGYCSGASPVVLLTVFVSTTGLLWYHDIHPWNANAVAPAPPPPVPCTIACAPTLGWNSWYALGEDRGWEFTTAATINATADALVKTGLADAGYRTVVVDDSWQATERSPPEAGLQADAGKFPKGMAAVAAHLQQHKLVLGLYTTPGNFTCAGAAGGGQRGSWGHVQADVDLWVNDWGVGYIKNCVCNTTRELRATAYAEMREAIDATQAPVVYECDNYMDHPWNSDEARDRTCNVWSTGEDVQDSFESWTRAMDLAVANNVNKYAGASPGGGGWALVDHLQVGGEQTWAEYRAQMSMFAVLPSPIFIGTDVRSISREALNIYKAREVLAIHQDAAGLPGARFHQDKILGTEVWVRPLQTFYGYLKAAFVLLNRGDEKQTITVSFKAIGTVVPGMQGWNTSGVLEGADQLEVEMRDVWAEKNIGSFSHVYTAIVDPHSCLLLTGLTPQRTLPKKQLTRT